MSEPVVVQGTAVDTAGGGPDLDPNFTKGEEQPKECRDVWAALLGVGNFIAMIVVGIMYGQDAWNALINNDTEYKYSGIVYMVLICGVISVIISGVMLLVMMAIPTLLIKFSLIFVIVLGLGLAVWSFFVGQIWGGVIGIIFFLIGVCYARAVWGRIPFASANLVTGCTAIKQNFGSVFVAFIFLLFAFAWSLIWGMAASGIYEQVYSNCVGNSCQINYGILFGMMLSFFFGHQIIQNSIHVIIAGCVGSWWFSPEDNGCCGSAVTGGTCRALTTSFGSICFGSLVVAIIQALRSLANEARNNGDAQCLACIAECILACLQGIVEYFNKWAFIYVGLYGYGYVEAGKNVITLFKNRGWEAIIADDLVSNVFFLLSLVTGGLVALAGYLISLSSEFLTEAGVGQNDEAWVAAVLGFVVGLVLCSVLMSTIASSVNAVIVLYAEAPAEFESNYPELSSEMRTAWVGAFPECM